MDWISSLLNLGSAIAGTFSASDIRKGQEQLRKAAEFQQQTELYRESFLTSTAPKLVLYAGATLVILLSIGFASSAARK